MLPSFMKSLPSLINLGLGGGLMGRVDESTGTDNDEERRVERTALERIGIMFMERERGIELKKKKIQRKPRLDIDRHR